MTKRIIFDMKLPQDILFIKDVFKANGFKLFVVGGAVRDAILGISPKDFDLATDATPDNVEQIMQNAGLTTLATGKAFGVINVFTSSGDFEIATFRKDSKEGDGRRPDSVEFTTIDGDVLRRDLTINALFFDIETGEIVDMVGGIDDLKNNIIRTVGYANDRFTEDRLRILRAIRFAGRFNSKLNQDIEFALMIDNSLDGISHERVRDEFLKGLKSAKNISWFLRLIDWFNLFDWIFPELNINKTFRINDDPIVVIASLLQFNDKTFLAKQLNKLTFSTDEIKAILFLISLQDLELETAVDIKRKQKNSGVSVDQILNFTTRECIPSQLIDAFLEFELSVIGGDVMKERGLEPGPELGLAIMEIETNNFKKILLFSNGDYNEISTR
jgi:tRNA nucleotidyltransferase/poly(A) polymerase